MKESWRAPGEDDRIEHVELLWGSGKVSINMSNGPPTGPSGISLRVDDRARADEICLRTVSFGANITQGPEETWLLIVSL